MAQSGRRWHSLTRTDENPLGFIRGAMIAKFFLASCSAFALGKGVTLALEREAKKPSTTSRHLH
jgi:hypothetical protein